MVLSSLTLERDSTTFFSVPWSIELVGSSSTILHKPDPSGALHIAARLGTTTDQLWMIGDTSTDMLTAQRSGMTGIGVLWGFRDREELENNGANHILGSPSELLELYNAYKLNG